jgi:hypothetical protein
MFYSKASSLQIKTHKMPPNWYLLAQAIVRPHLMLVTMQRTVTHSRCQSLTGLTTCVMGSQTPSSLHDGELSVLSSDLGFPKDFVGILNQVTNSLATNYATMPFSHCNLLIVLRYSVYIEIQNTQRHD